MRSLVYDLLLEPEVVVDVDGVRSFDFEGDFVELMLFFIFFIKVIYFYSSAPDYDDEYSVVSSRRVSLLDVFGLLAYLFVKLTLL